MAKKTHLKIRFVSDQPMSKDGYRQWSKGLRAKVHKRVYGKDGSIFCMTVPVERLKNFEEIGDLAAENLYSGNWVMMGYSKGKTRTKVKLVGLCKIDLKFNEDGTHRAIVTHCKYARLARYWFFEGKNE